MRTHYDDLTPAAKISQKRKRPRQDSQNTAESFVLAVPDVGVAAAYGRWVNMLRSKAAGSPTDETPTLLRFERRGARTAVAARTQAKKARAAERDRHRLSIDLVEQLRELIGHELKRVEEPRTARLDARLTAKERSVIQRAADISGRSLSEFVIHAAHQAALLEIEHQVVLRLSERDSETLAAALDAEPAEPTAAFKRAVAMRNKIVHDMKADKD
ncbi:DUF1778 domain-containing protein [Achromobacter xylosoxidans]|uniref:type II toxin-antitoxin system TacA family antitoxin n=1 Tax=Alcaligenes xylosoxydans xylosoxydans TaxID=85698 RepID=UPI0006860E61|nr:DUF1778 domain-containing protein [Achromobacter xylosoxidans]